MKMFHHNLLLLYRSLSSLFKTVKPKNIGNKKDVGVCFSAPIPVFRPSHCPQIKDKQRKPAHAKSIIYTTLHYIL